MKRLLCLICLVPVLFGFTKLSAQTANWTNAVGGDWNVAVNWDNNIVPGVGTNANISPTNMANAYTVSYLTPMSAASIGGLVVTNTKSVRATLLIATNGFNVIGTGTAVFIGTNGSLVITNGGALNVSAGNMSFNASYGNLYPGGSLAVTNGGTAFLNVGNSIATALTNNGGNIIVDNITINSGNGNVDSVLMITGGTNFLGNFLMNRGNSGGNSSLPSFLKNGLIISNGLVNLSGAIVGGNNSWGQIDVLGGIVTNTGDFLIARQATTTRGGVFAQTGGLVVSTTNSGIRMLVNNANQLAAFYVTGGTNIAEGYVLGDSTVATGTANLTNAATMVVGSVGITNASNGGGVAANVGLNNGGIFAAKADWTGSVPMSLASAGTFTFQAADLDNTPHNITLLAALRGTGTLKKTGAGVLTLSGTNIYTGNTLINNGTLTLGATGTLSNSVQIVVNSGATFDVSAIPGSFVLNSGQTLAGSGTVTGAVTVVTGATISPGTNGAPGTLNFSNSLTETGNTINNFDLSNNPLGSGNDLINIVGDLNVSGVTNKIQISGTLPNGSDYTLIKYSGAFNGDLTNFFLAGATGYVTNNVAGKKIMLHTLATSRGPANIAWVGNSLTNNWDTTLTTNWFNAGVLDYFIPNDNVRFDATGAANPIVNISGSVIPASVVVDAATDYVFVSTVAGSIDGSTGLVKTNTGILTILSTNNYTGVTTIAKGVLQLTTLPNGGTGNPGPIGASASDSGNLVIGNATLRYSGDTTVSDRGATLTGTSVIEVTNAATSLTLGGVIAGGGTLTKAGLGTLILTSVNSYASNNLAGGILQAAGAGDLGPGTINFLGGTLSLASAGSQQFYANNLNVVSNGLLIVNGANGNNILGTSGGNGGAFFGSNTLNISIPASGGLFTINSDMGTNFTGTLHLTDDTVGSLRFNSGGSASALQQSVGSPLVTFDLGNGTATLLNRNGANTNYYLGALVGGTGTFLSGANNGSVTGGYRIGDKNLNTTFKGTIKNGGGTTSILKVGTGTLSLAGQNTYTSTTTISNGVLALITNPDNSQDGSIGSSATISLKSGAVLDVSGRSDGTMPLNSGQVLNGNGTVRGILDNSAGGTIAPGNGLNGALGILTVTNTINLGGTTWMKLNRASATNSDRLISSTASVINYGGTLVITNVGAPLQAGDTFTLFSAATRNNSFSTVTLPNYYTWNTSQLNVNGQISVTAFAPPVLTNVDFSMLGSGTITINAVNGAPGGAVSVLTSTNLLLPLSNWTTVATGNFDGSGNFSVPITVDPALPQSYFTLKAN